jgi:hypothetical protein
LRENMAKAHGAAATCPLVTGILWRVIGEAAEEDRASGVDEVTPYWRILKRGGKFNEKHPGGADSHRKLLEAEQKSTT